MKAAMMEKLEAPFRAKCDTLAAEAEAAQAAFVGARREAEQLRSSCRALELRAARDAEAAAAEHTAALSALRDEVQALKRNAGTVPLRWEGGQTGVCGVRVCGWTPPT
eukprot:362671-Chlamydomonas_euryale.AAC.8